MLGELTKEKPINPDVTPVRTTSRTNTELVSRFREYEQKFVATWLRVFEPIDAAAEIMANVSKSEIAQVLNETLSKPITLKQHFNLARTEFNEKLELKRGDIDCEGVRTKFDYPRFRGDSCDWDCMIETVLGRVEDPVCAASRRACRLKVEGERLICRRHEKPRELNIRQKMR